MLFRLVVLMSVFCVLQAAPAQAMGKKKPKPTSVTYAAPRPVRNVHITTVGTTPFRIPNGKEQQETISADLGALLDAAVSGTRVLKPKDDQQQDPCGTWLEFRSGVSILELKILQLGVSVGYSHETDLNSHALSELQGEVDVDIGNLVMKFAVFSCSKSGCQEIVTSEATAVTAGVDASVKMNFTDISIGPDLIWKSPLGNVFRSVMADGLKKLVAKADFDNLPWFAKIYRDYDPKYADLVFFDAGDSTLVGLNQAFEVYTLRESSGECNVHDIVAYGHTVDVSNSSSILQVDKTIFDLNNIKTGDIVKVNIGGYSVPAVNPSTCKY